ncbi:hypothetical protein DPMN_072744 [Dreissena polymorpha]|uniref:Uncharacterized protein n=1 Tax=Dreissena polymorpha TaxID=45954 RepID=A0A9D4BXV0_DREPO|nr:hypothetical protein DPMN_072744 [Dreissena polymorpha]
MEFIPQKERIYFSATCTRTLPTESFGDFSSEKTAKLKLTRTRNKGAVKGNLRKITANDTNHYTAQLELTRTSDKVAVNGNAKQEIAKRPNRRERKALARRTVNRKRPLTRIQEVWSEATLSSIKSPMANDQTAR